MQENSSFCNFSNLERIGNKDANHSRIIAENSCLRERVNELKVELDKQEDKVESLSSDLATLKGELNTFLSTQEQRWESHNNKHVEFTEARNQSVNEIMNTYDSFATWMGILIAAAAVFSFLFIGRFKKKEVEEVVNEATQQIENKVQDSGFLLPAVANSFDSEQVKEILDELKVDIISEQEFLIEQMIEERTGNDFAGFDDVTNEQV